MRTRPFGSTGIDVPVIGQGTWRMESDDRDACIETLRRGLDLGLTHVDTAELYGMGAVEELVGEAIAGRRNEVFLVSKVMPSNASHRGTIRACEKSLSRLGTDRLDCYLLHWPGEHPLEETFRAFEELQAAGKIGSYGVSNFDVGELDRAVVIAGDGVLACNQVLYHLEERYIERDLVAWCVAHDIAVVGYSPFGAGAFPAPRSTGGRVLAEIAMSRGISPRAVALAFLCRARGTFVIPKTSRVAHVEDNARAGELVLTVEETARIHDAFAPSREDSLPVI